MNNLGINTVNLPIQKLDHFGLGRAEVCLGRGNTYTDRLKRTLSEIEYAELNKIPYSIHLPVYVEDWYPYDYLTAFFLDPSEDMRQLALRLLNYNLEHLSANNPDFYVLHFGGVYDNLHREKEFDLWLKDALDGVQALAKKHNVKILIEYFGSNKNFAHYSEWIEAVKTRSHLGLLTDLGHLHFASIINGFAYEEALAELVKESEAFHIWTTQGKEVYFKSDFYKTYHHIIPRLDQTIEDGWIFDLRKVFKLLKETGKPIILEASKIYEGENYFLDGVKECVELINN